MIDRWANFCRMVCRERIGLTRLTRLVFRSIFRWYEVKDDFFKFLSTTRSRTIIMRCPFLITICCTILFENGFLPFRTRILRQLARLPTFYSNVRKPSLEMLWLTIRLRSIFNVLVSTPEFLKPPTLLSSRLVHLSK